MESAPRPPQLQALPGLVRRLYDLPQVETVFLGGSLARGGGDAYSDIDLLVVVDGSCQDFLSDEAIRQTAGIAPLATVRFPLGPASWMHQLILPGGIVVDLNCQRDVPKAQLSQLIELDQECSQLHSSRRSQSPRAWQPAAIYDEEVGGLVQTFWVTALKHRRGILRQQELLIWIGLNLSRAQLVRLQFLAEMDRDCGDLARMGIYTLSAIQDWLQERGRAELGPEILRLGADGDWTDAVSRMLTKGAEICQTLRERRRLPARLMDLETMVIAEWQRALDAAA